MPKRKPELVATRNWLKSMFHQGARTHRFIDAGVENPYDFYLFISKELSNTPNGIWMPGEAKFMRGGVTFNVERWRNGPQSQQYKNLLSDSAKGAHAFFLVFWIPNKCRNIQPRCMRIEDLPLDKIKLKQMTEVRTIEELINL